MQMRMIIGFILISISSGTIPAWAGSAAADSQQAADQVYADAQAYVEDAFAGHNVPQPGTVWPTGALRQQLQRILGHKPGLRFRYWGANGRTVWIMDEIGKDRPITAGIVIDKGKISDIRVLVFRESRGWEVKYDFFTNQFASLWLNEDDDLSAPIDNITGATLSVKAMTRMARAALKLHEHTNQAAQTLVTAR